MLLINLFSFLEQGIVNFIDLLVSSQMAFLIKGSNMLFISIQGGLRCLLEMNVWADSLNTTEHYATVNLWNEETKKIKKFKKWLNASGNKSFVISHYDPPLSPSKNKQKKKRKTFIVWCWVVRLNPSFLNSFSLSSKNNPFCNFHQFFFWVLM